MTNETIVLLVRAYLNLSDLHRQAAREEGEQNARNAWHLNQAETAEVAAMAWHHSANRPVSGSVRDVGGFHG
jgi:hypothetical protein